MADPPPVGGTDGEAAGGFFIGFFLAAPAGLATALAAGLAAATHDRAPAVLACLLYAVLGVAWWVVARRSLRLLPVTTSREPRILRVH